MLDATPSTWERCSTIALETQRRNGTWVATPVSLAVSDGHAFFRTYSVSGKAKPLRHFDEVRVAPCSFFGRPSGPATMARARLLEHAEVPLARRALAKRHPVLQGVAVPLAHRLMRYRTLHYELTFAGRP
jgi:PPOX class probable F420-dependent enzyme